jgi:MFS family permease
VYTPGLEQVSNEFGVSREVAILPFVFYLLGLSFGPILAGPSSETFGRKAVYITALPGVAAFTLGAGFSQNITSLIVCRFFAGLFASPGLSIGTAMVSDFLPPEKRGGPVAIFITMVQMGIYIV